MQLQLKGMDVLRQDILCFNRRQSILQELWSYYVRF